MRRWNGAREGKPIVLGFNRNFKKYTEREKEKGKNM